MFLARVKGEVVCTIKHSSWTGRRALIVDRIDPEGKELGSYLIAFAAVDAGVGQTVLVLDEGNSARQIVNDPQAPIRSVVIGIVDEIART
jgi:ethanolamine utilization protein EutN